MWRDDWGEMHLHGLQVCGLQLPEVMEAGVKKIVLGVTNLELLESN